MNISKKYIVLLFAILFFGGFIAFACIPEKVLPPGVLKGCIGIILIVFNFTLIPYSIYLFAGGSLKETAFNSDILPLSLNVLLKTIDIEQRKHAIELEKSTIKYLKEKIQEVRLSKECLQIVLDEICEKANIDIGRIVISKFEYINGYKCLVDKNYDPQHIEIDKETGQITINLPGTFKWKNVIYVLMNLISICLILIKDINFNAALFPYIKEIIPIKLGFEKYYIKGKKLDVVIKETYRYTTHRITDYGIISTKDYKKLYYLAKLPDGKRNNLNRHFAEVYNTLLYETNLENNEEFKIDYKMPNETKNEKFYKLLTQYIIKITKNKK